jgi:hypothetical protein
MDAWQAEAYRAAVERAWELHDWLAQVDETERRHARYIAAALSDPKEDA